MFQWNLHRITLKRIISVVLGAEVSRCEYRCSKNWGKNLTKLHGLLLETQFRLEATSIHVRPCRWKGGDEGLGCHTGSLSWWWLADGECSCTLSICTVQVPCAAGYCWLQPTSQATSDWLLDTGNHASKPLLSHHRPSPAPCPESSLVNYMHLCPSLPILLHMKTEYLDSVQDRDWGKTGLW